MAGETTRWKFATALSVVFALVTIIRGHTSPRAETSASVESESSEAEPSDSRPAADRTESIGRPRHPGAGHVREMVARLGRARSDEQRCHLMSQLLRSDGEGIARPLFAIATSRSTEWSRRCAVRALGRSGEEESREHLRRLVSTTRAHVRADVLAALTASDDAESLSIVFAAARGADVGLRFAALEALGENHVRDAVPLLIDELASASGDSRRRLVVALGNSEDPTAVAALMPLLDDPSASTRSAALTALGRLGTPAAIEALGERARAVNESDAASVMTALAESSNPEARELLFASARDGGNGARLAALRALETADGDDVRSFMLEMFDSDPDVSGRHAVRWFAQHDDATLLPRLRERVRSFPDRAESLVHAIADLSGDDARNALVEIAANNPLAGGAALDAIERLPGAEADARRIATDIIRQGRPGESRALEILAIDADPDAAAVLATAARDPRVSSSAIDALGRRRDGASVDALRALAASGDSGPRDEAQRALMNMGGTIGESAALDAARDPNLRGVGLVALAQSNSPAAMQALRDAAEGADPDSRRDAINALSRGPHNVAATEQLARLAHDRDPSVASEALSAYVHFDHEHAASTIDTAMQSSDATMRGAAVLAARDLSIDSRMSVYRTAVRDASSEIAANAMEGLSSVGTPEAAQLVVEMLENTSADPAVRLAAADALERLGGPDAARLASVIAAVREAAR